MKKKFWRGFTTIAAGLLTFSVGVGMLCETWRGTIDTVTGTKSSILVTTEDDGNAYAYLSDYSTTDELVQAHKEKNEQYSEEGSVLLKNDGTLPLKKGSAVTLLGSNSHYPYYGERMGATAEASEVVSFEDALRDRGFEVNQTMVDLYETLGNILTKEDAGDAIPIFGEDTSMYGYRPGTLNINLMAPGPAGTYAVGEPPLSVYKENNPNYADSFAQYHDAAIVVIGRQNTEGADYVQGKAGLDEGETGTTPLALNEEERAMIQMACDNFDKVVVLVNSVCQMEIDELKTNDKIGSILWVGMPGCYGFYGVADILNGDVSPSGHLYSTYAVDSQSAPAVTNFGDFAFTNGDDIDAIANKASRYVVEAEGIYSGYKYYETRYADSVMGQGNATSAAGSSKGGQWNYADEVSYGFGFGLSYSEFEQTLDSVTFEDDNKVTVTVTIKNVGDTAGKDVAQIYAQTPYTEYDKENLVEKSAVQLIDYVKSDVLEPGESQTLTTTFDMKYLASYDYTKAKTYIMDAGDYYLALGNGAHDALNNILAAQGYSVADGMDDDGDKGLAYQWTQDELDTETFATSAATGKEITNQLEDMDLNYWLPGTVTYLSRQDWEGTWPVAYKDITANDKMMGAMAPGAYEIKTGEDTSAIFPEKDNGLSFMEMKGIPYEESVWDELMDQVTLEEALYGIRVGGTQPKHYDSINMTVDAQESDGPSGFGFGEMGSRSVDKNSPCYIASDDENYNYKLNDMVCEAIIASAFNKELARDQGVLFGNDSLWSNTTIFFAPGMNLHRSPYNARNGEYYSEDSMLTNYCGSAVIEGATTKGCLIIPKHFVYNDQETNRIGNCEFMNEQQAREGELRAFEGVVDAGCQGMMTSLPRLGVTFSSAHVGLMQNILRGEWGYTGFLMTDICFEMYADYMSVKDSVIGGTTLMGISSDSCVEKGKTWDYFTVEGVKGDATLCQAVRDNTKYLLCALANSNVMNGVNTSSKVVNQMTWWRGLYIGGIVVFGLLTLLGLVKYIVIWVKKRRSEDE